MQATTGACVNNDLFPYRSKSLYYVAEYVDLVRRTNTVHTRTNRRKWRENEEPSLFASPFRPLLSPLFLPSPFFPQMSAPRYSK
jgi:hypothetical protein